MKNLLRIEELAGFIFGAVWYYQLPVPFWSFWVLLLAPDLGALGYLFNNRWGAIGYNLCHHKAIALLGLGLGWKLDLAWVEAAGAILFAHSCIDRVFGYGLKYLRSFKDTHLGKLK